MASIVYNYSPKTTKILFQDAVYRLTRVTLKNYKDEGNAKLSYYHNSIQPPYISPKFPNNITFLPI